MPVPGDEGDRQRAAEHDETQHRFDRQPDRLPVDQNRHAGQLAEPRRLERHERAVEHQEGHDRETGEHHRLDIQRRPEHVDVAERVEPQRLDVIRQRRSAAEHDRGKNGENGTGRRGYGARASRRRPVDDAGGIVHGEGFTFLDAIMTNHRTYERSETAQDRRREGWRRRRRDRRSGWRRRSGRRSVDDDDRHRRRRAARRRSASSSPKPAPRWCG